MKPVAAGGVGAVSFVLGVVALFLLMGGLREVYDVFDWTRAEHRKAIAVAATFIVLGTSAGVTATGAWAMCRRFDLPLLIALAVAAVLAGANAFWILQLVTDVNSCGIFVAFPDESGRACLD